MPSWLCEGVSPSGTGASSQVCDDPQDWRYSRAELGQTNGVGSCTAQGGCGSAYYDGGEAFAIQLSQWVDKKHIRLQIQKRCRKFSTSLWTGIQLQPVVGIWCLGTIKMRWIHGR